MLGLWLYQQTEVERRSGELRKLASARSVYQTYQSHNAIFNAINEVVGDNKKASRQLRIYQIYNYELGLKSIEAALSESDKAGIPEAPDAYDPAEDISAKMDRTQKRLEQLQIRLDEKEDLLRNATDRARVRSLRSYIALSLISIFGAVCKILDKLSPKPA